MTDNKDTVPALQKISETVEHLDKTSRELLGVMDEQINAIISSDTGKMEEFTEAHSTIRCQFKKYEKAFVKELHEVIDPVTDELESLRLVNLKKIFPESALLVDHWKELLSRNTRQLQRKHEQLLQLLNFAMSRNTDVMRSIYSIYNLKNSHYSANGDKTGTVSGVALNQEV
ncbi:MAG TPA: hypothetical protein VJ905_04975 [Halalkalibaculum sp.]|nr:hypothetical protein [Halalkalibaculum sp.]